MLNRTGPEQNSEQEKKKIVPRIPGQLKQTDTNWTDRLNQGVQTGGGDEERPKRTKTNTAWLTLIDAQKLAHCARCARLISGDATNSLWRDRKLVD